MGMQNPDPMVRMRAADTAEKVSAQHLDYLSPYKDELLHRIAESTQQEVRWHVAQMLPRFALSADEQAVAVALLYEYLNDRSPIVQTFALDALTTFAQRDSALRSEVVRLLHQAQGTERAPLCISWAITGWQRMRERSFPRVAVRGICHCMPKGERDARSR